MSRTIAMLTVMAAVTLSMAFAGQANAGSPYSIAQRRAMHYNWAGNYAHSSYGQPVALVVPPTAQLQTNWGWGVGSSRISRIDHQFGRDYPGPGAGMAGGFRMLPRWPHDTTNMGVYYVRGPW